MVLILAYPNLPSLEVLTDYRPKIPLRVYSSDGALIGEFGEERRALVRIQDVPPVMKHAILAAEDERFYQHGGVLDTLGVLRAAVANLSGGGKRRGFHHHHAGGTQLLPLQREDPVPQVL